MGADASFFSRARSSLGGAAASTGGAPPSSGPGSEGLAGQPGQPEDPAGPRYFRASDLMKVQFPPLKWAVPNLIPEGVTLLAGRPKGGKSWLMLHVALAIACGGKVFGKIDVPRGQVLYLALEDGPRRIQDRLAKMATAQQTTIPDELVLVCEYRTTHDGGLEALTAYLDTHPDLRLVVIDILAKIRDPRQRGGNLYDQDYEAISSFQKLAQDHNVPIVLVHHTRKGEIPETPLEAVSGSAGITGAADSTLVLKHPSHSDSAKLYLTGRDTADRELTLLWDARYCLWQQAPDDALAGLTALQRQVIETVLRAGRPLTPMDLHAALGNDKAYEANRKSFKRMAEVGLLTQTDQGGAYDVPAKFRNPPDTADRPDNGGDV